jgi:CDP-diacylglycerol--serine O-phosphatidyltransferase
LPNVLTVLALCAGLTAIRYGLEGDFRSAVAFVTAAIVLDGLDGRAARVLKVTSRFGAELDSLADFVSFGAAPAVLVYLWSLSAFPGPGWALVLLFATCCALRLARFNIETDVPDRPAWMANFFTGLPAPAGAGAVLLPMILSFAVDAEWPRFWLLNAAVTVALAYLMVSRVPTWSIKRVRVRPEYTLPALLVAGVLAASLFSDPWSTLFVLGTMYLLTLPVAVFMAGRYRRREPAAETEQVPAPGE